MSSAVAHGGVQPLGAGRSCTALPWLPSEVSSRNHWATACTVPVDAHGNVASTVEPWKTRFGSALPFSVMWTVFVFRSLAWKFVKWTLIVSHVRENAPVCAEAGPAV